MRKRAELILRLLSEEYPATPCRLNYSNGFELLVATILSAQCTDERVNLVTRKFFRQFPDSAALAVADQYEVEETIRSTGFFRNKSRNLISCAQVLQTKHGGMVPNSIDQLILLPGVGRKTANVMQAHWFKNPAVVVDTHFRRVVTRLKLTTGSNPDQIEAQIKDFVLSEDQTQFSGTVNYHGRLCCTARNPNCEECPLATLCPYNTC